MNTLQVFFGSEVWYLVLVLGDLGFLHYAGCIMKLAWEGGMTGPN